VAADAQFAINIAAAMPAGEATVAQLDALTSELMGAGKGAEHFTTALARVSTSLDSAKAASVAANASLADGKAGYAQLERAALQASKAAEKAALKGVVPPDVAAKAAQASSAVNQYAGVLATLERRAKSAAAEETHLASTLGNVKKLAGHVDKTLAGNAERLSKLQGSLSAVGGPLGRLGSGLVAPVKGFQELSGSIGSAKAAALLGAVGFAAVAAAVVLVTVAAIAGTVAIAAWAVGLADANRNAALATEAAEAMHPELEGLSGDFAVLQADTGLSSKTLRKLTKDLTDAKVSAEDMPEALRAAAYAERALADEGGAADFVKQIKEADGAVGDLAAQFSGKLGPIVAKQMRSLDSQGEKFKKNISGLFGGLNIEPVLAGLERLVALFDSGTESGEAMKFLFNSVFQPLINQAENAAVVIEAFALGFLIGLTKVYIAIKPAIAAVREFFGFEDTSLTDVLAIATKAGEYAAYIFVGFAVVLAAVVAAVGAVIGVLLLVAAEVTAVGAAVLYAGALIVGGFIDAWNAVTEFLGGLDLVQIGTDLMMGLVEGITNAAGAVASAVSGAVGGAIDSAKSLLGIASPSKVFASFGENTGEGFVQGVEDTTGDAQSALGDLVAPPSVATVAEGGAPAAAGGEGGGASINLAGAQFHFYGVKDAENAEQSFGEMLTRVLEGDVATLGGEAAPV
jgi:hypothetical protein